MTTPVPEDRSVLERPAPGPTDTRRYRPDDSAVVDLWLPSDQTQQGSAPAKPLVVMIHGGFWRPAFDRQHCRPLANALAAAGYPVALPEYRRIPGQPDLALADVNDAITYLGNQHDLVPPGAGMVVMGHSAGGHLSLLVANHPPHPAVIGVVALAPVADLQTAHAASLGDHATLAFLGRPPAERPDLDPAQNPVPLVGTVIVHGRWDTVVPIELTHRYVNQYLDAVAVEGGHGVVTRIEPADHQPLHRNDPDEGFAAPLAVVESTSAAHFQLIDPESDAWASIPKAIDSVIP